MKGKWPARKFLSAQARECVLQSRWGEQESRLLPLEDVTSRAGMRHRGAVKNNHVHGCILDGAILGAGGLESLIDRREGNCTLSSSSRLSVTLLIGMFTDYIWVAG